MDTWREPETPVVTPTGDITQELAANPEPIKNELASAYPGETGKPSPPPPPPCTVPLPPDTAPRPVNTPNVGFKHAAAALNPGVPQPITVFEIKRLSDETLADIKAVRDLLNNEIDLRGVYDHSPEPIQRLTRLMLTNEPRVPAPVHFFAAWSMIAGIFGKRVSIMNGGRELYPAYWYVALVLSGLGKSSVRQIQRRLNEVLRERGYRVPVRLAPDKFTISALISSYGETCKGYASLSDQAQAIKDDEMRAVCERKPGRLMISDEFGFHLRKIISSGIEGGEQGSLLQLADSGATISGDTKQDGKRLIHDACWGICGFSQPATWDEAYKPEECLESGLSGRFMMVRDGHYRLEIEPDREMTRSELDEALRRVFRDVFDRLDTIPIPRYRVEEPPGVDARGAAFETLCQDPVFKAVIDRGYLDVQRLRGKLIMLACKWTLIHQILTQNVDIQGLPVESRARTQAEIPHEYSVNGTEPVDLRWRVTAPGPWSQSEFDWYLRMALTTAVKAYTADPGQSLHEKWQEGAIRTLIKHGGHRGLGQLRNKVGRVKGVPQKRRDFLENVIHPLIEAGKVQVVAHGASNQSVILVDKAQSPVSGSEYEPKLKPVG